MTSSRDRYSGTTIRSLIEEKHSKAQCLKIVALVGQNQKRFDTLVRVFLEGPYRITQRAAWPLSYCAESNPQLVRRHIPALIHLLQRPGLHPAVKRNILRMFQFIEIPEAYYSLMLQLCESCLMGKEPVAIQVFAMEAWAQIAQYYPELRSELCVILEEHLPLASPAYRARASRILRSFACQPLA